MREGTYFKKVKSWKSLFESKIYLKYILMIY